MPVMHCIHQFCLSSWLCYFILFARNINVLPSYDRENQFTYNEFVNGSSMNLGVFTITTRNTDSAYLIEWLLNEPRCFHHYHPEHWFCLFDFSIRTLLTLTEPSSKFSGSAHICDKQNQAIVGSVESSEAYEALVFKINTLLEQICVFFNRKLAQIGI